MLFSFPATQLNFPLDFSHHSRTSLRPLPRRRPCVNCQMLPTTPLSSASERSSETCVLHLAWPAQLFDPIPFDLLSRVRCLVPVVLSRYINLFAPSLQWVSWPPLAGALRFPTFDGTMGS